MLTTTPINGEPLPGIHHIHIHPLLDRCTTSSHCFPIFFSFFILFWVPCTLCSDMQVLFEKMSQRNMTAREYQDDGQSPPLPLSHLFKYLILPNAIMTEHTSYFIVVDCNSD
eukprot:TRINITY_DN6942_c0_g1_i3.p1 TRINITY_DN6942_c0_g1~~TRINITY_DN6942_c0_g1_i3.p1  ORF type:complete len:112 (+),score=1.40 TRINITY_DN6942_c0_g1_i3:563-898(+)